MELLKCFIIFELGILVGVGILLFFQGAHSNERDE